MKECLVVVRHLTVCVCVLVYGKDPAGTKYGYEDEVSAEPIDCACKPLRLSPLWHADLDAVLSHLCQS
jgi:hypothetical protein